MNNNFAVFILSHNRAHNVVTYKKLREQNYTGDIYIIIDDEDKDKELYYTIYKDQVIEFSKDEAIKKFDIGDTFKDRRAVVYARNECWDIAEKLGIEYFMVLDDDYSVFLHKYDKEQNFGAYKIKNLDNVFNIMLRYYKNINAKAIAMAQSGDYIGGTEFGYKQKNQLRKCMNSFICSTKRRFTFNGRINEDVNAYIDHGSRGDIFLTIPWVGIEQASTQQNSGGLTDIYLNLGTYVKSFYTVLYQPSCVKIKLMGVTQKRLHHTIKWDNAVPKIIKEKYKGDR